MKGHLSVLVNNLAVGVVAITTSTVWISLPLDEAIASRAVIVIVSGSDELMDGHILEPAKYVFF